MGLFDGDLEKIQAENKELKRETIRLKETIDKLQENLLGKVDSFAEKFDRVQGTFIKIRELSGCLEAQTAMELAWSILSASLGIERGGIFKIDGRRLRPVLGSNLSERSPEISLDEESVITHALDQNITLTADSIRESQDLSGLNRRGAYPEVRIVSPFQIGGLTGGIILICKLGGHLFSGSVDDDLVRIVASILGLSLTKAKIVEDQRKTLDSKARELEKLRNVFSHMVSPDIIRTIEANPNGISLGGSRQTAVIMFIDIRGFTHLSETLVPERLVEMLNQYFGCITEIILRHRGTLDKFIGDAVMALFNTPVPIKNPSRWAFAAAIEIQKSIRNLVERLQSFGYPRFEIGIGLNFQDVVAGMIGSKQLSSFTAIGDGVNIASRLCSIAKPGEIVVSKKIHDNLKGWPGYFETREGITLKGKSRPTSIFVHYPTHASPPVDLPDDEILPERTNKNILPSAFEFESQIELVTGTSDEPGKVDAKSIWKRLPEESGISFLGDRPISLEEERRRRESKVPYLIGWGSQGELSRHLHVYYDSEEEKTSVKGHKIISYRKICSQCGLRMESPYQFCEKCRFNF